MANSISYFIEHNDLSGLEGALKSDSSPADSDRGYDQPIHIAAGYGKAAIVALLIQYGADVDARNEDGRTALHLAADLHPDVVQVLLQHNADPNIYDQYGYTPIAWAALGQQPEGETVIGLLRAAGAKYGLLEAAAMGDLLTVKNILAIDSTTVHKEPSAETLLSMACLAGRYGNLEDRAAIVKLLLANGIDLSEEAIETHILACERYKTHDISDLLRDYKERRF